MALLVAVAFSVFFSGQASAVTVLFTGNAAVGGTDQGVIGHDFVSAGTVGAANAPMGAFYSTFGVAGPYTSLATPDAYDFVTGGELAIGANAPTRSLGATAPASAALASVGINGALHLGIRGLTLDFGNAADLFTTGATTERRIYRNGEVKVFEETAPNVFAEVASYTGGIFTIDIDYSTGFITNVFSGTKSVGSLSIFPGTWTGTSFGPIDLAGSSPEIYGGLRITSSLEIGEQVAVPEPEMPAAVSRIGSTHTW
ncbi:MAG: hypothetical protein EBU57_02000 [Alphaproteobacteria bacterium]|nr:hypothetical protein [Alphaproteobacteria bacterium]